MAHYVIKSVTWDDVRLATVSDPSMSRLIELIDDFPVLRGDLPPELRQYHQFRDGLTSFEGGSPLQRPHCHPPIPPRSHTSGPALSSSGCLTNVFTGGIIILLARYDTCYYRDAGSLLIMQPHGTLTAERTTHPSTQPSLPIPVPCVRLLPLPWPALLGGCG